MQEVEGARGVAFAQGDDAGRLVFERLVEQGCERRFFEIAAQHEHRLEGRPSTLSSGRGARLQSGRGGNSRGGRPTVSLLGLDVVALFRRRRHLSLADTHINGGHALAYGLAYSVEAGAL